jgi:hypothetical protein
LHLYYTIKALNENFQFLEVDEDFLGCEIKRMKDMKIST